MFVEAAATLAAPIIEKHVVCVSDASARHLHYLTKFKDNYESLRSKMDELIALRDDVNGRIAVEVTREQTKRTHVVVQWLQTVETFTPGVNLILLQCHLEIEQRWCANYCPKNWWARYKPGKEVCKKLKVVVEIFSQGQFEVVADKVLPGRVEVKNESQSIGMHKSLAKVSSWLGDDAVKIIGIYGMGGVGKTSLLKKINNAFEEKEVNAFNMVIWVVVSSQFSIQNVQKQIGKRLGLAWSKNDDQDHKAQLIFNALSTKKFLLLLDDVWVPLNFDEIGIPSQNHSKVVFITRSESACGEMETNKKFKVHMLVWDEAWTLFQQKLGQEALKSSKKPKLAESVARECGGLPLALIAIGRAMASKKTPYEWNYDLKTLQKYASGFSGMEQKVLSILKFSYDNLKDDTARDCFLYFCLDSLIPLLRKS